MRLKGEFRGRACLLTRANTAPGGEAELERLPKLDGSHQVRQVDGFVEGLVFVLL